MREGEQMNTTLRTSKHKTQRYIVEAPMPDKGQLPSSGGIRENGKLTAQYKNPVPYTDPAPCPSKPFTAPKSIAHTGELNDIRKYFVKELSEIIWVELGKPILKAKLHQLSEKILTNEHVTSTSRKGPSVDTSQANVPMTDKIIPFPRKDAS